MKKTITLIIAMLMVMTMVTATGCGKSKEDESSTPSLGEINENASDPVGVNDEKSEKTSEESEEDNSEKEAMIQVDEITDDETLVIEDGFFTYSGESFSELIPMLEELTGEDIDETEKIITLKIETDKGNGFTIKMKKEIIDGTYAVTFKFHEPESESDPERADYEFAGITPDVTTDEFKSISTKNPDMEGYYEIGSAGYTETEGKYARINARCDYDGYDNKISSVTIVYSGIPA
ncbi:MAG: hypothetical protein IJY73_03345 [Oscillospiraceae bacterium]|nr:hypothetical protein [Oscillospiraceae bacterium]